MGFVDLWRFLFMLGCSGFGYFAFLPMLSCLPRTGIADFVIFVLLFGWFCWFCVSASVLCLGLIWSGFGGIVSLDGFSGLECVFGILTFWRFDFDFCSLSCYLDGFGVFEILCCCFWFCWFWAEVRLLGLV